MIFTQRFVLLGDNLLNVFVIKWKGVIRVSSGVRHCSNHLISINRLGEEKSFDFLPYVYPTSFLTSSQCLFSHLLTSHPGFTVRYRIKCILSNKTVRFLTGRNKLLGICWQCNCTLTALHFTCKLCGAVQQPNENLNCFEVMGESPRFDIDGKKLTETFRNLQRLLHPDKFATKSKEEQEYSQQQSSIVNKAYQTLLKPMERGLYLLEMNGKPLLEGELHMDSEFLMDIMAVNEHLDGISSSEDIEFIHKQNDEILTRLFKEVSDAFKEGDFERARLCLAKLKYYVNIDEKVKKLRELHGMTEK